MRITLAQFIVATLIYIKEAITRPLEYDTELEAEKDARKYGLKLKSFEDGKAIFSGIPEDVARYVILELNPLQNPQEVLNLFKVNKIEGM